MAEGALFGQEARDPGHFIASPEKEAASISWWRDVWRRFWRQKLAVGAGVILLILVLTSLLAPFVAPYDPIQQFRREGLSDLGEPLPPNRQFWLGTDGVGRDLLSRVIWGGRISLGIGLMASFIAVTIALFLGGGAGFFGR